MSEKDYRKLYLNQNNILEMMKSVEADFYLTGGTALGRFYLNHRFSEDLDFFVNSDPDFNRKINLIEKQLDNDFKILREQSVVYDNYAKYIIDFKDSLLKLEFVNDVQYRCGKPVRYIFGFVDTPLNILANKLTAVVSRDEPKDVFDIYSIALNYRFNWITVFEEAKKKSIINEIDVEQRLRDFPVNMMSQIDWFVNPFDEDMFTRVMQKITNDFILGKDNSAGKDQTPIEDAMPLLSSKQ